MQWLEDACFPFWAERAEHPSGGFRERLTLEGDPLDDELSRVRVQARQTFVFSRAALMGWRPDEARRLVQVGLASLLGSCRRSDGLVGKVVRLGGGLADAQPELYDNAFAMLALAWAARALDAPELIGEAGVIFDRLDATHSHPSGGFHETLPPRSPRRQNPHMHLFEASLALYEASGDEQYAIRADELLRLFETRFFNRETGHVREQLSETLEEAPGPSGNQIEPGHAFEWVALIAQRSRLLDDPAPDYVAHLYSSALRACDPVGRVPLSTSHSRGHADPSRRIWSQTEALRAHVARAADGDEAALVRARRQLDVLFAEHLEPAPYGGWLDHVDADGKRLSDAMTAATGYHLVTALAEVSASPLLNAGETFGAVA
jgi:mannose-6-phosphate isomerase